MENDPRDRFDDLQELRFRDEPKGEPQSEPDERTTFDPARFDVFDADLDTEPELVFTPEPDNVPAPESRFDFDNEPPLEPVSDPAGAAPPDWLTAPPEPDALDDNTPFELLILDVFDEGEDELG
jgi:hypothetical protein